jgi:hypothetical protein
VQKVISVKDVLMTVAKYQQGACRGGFMLAWAVACGIISKA